MSKAQILQADKIVTIPAASTAAEIQALIDAQPKNLNKYQLTFQFEDGTYALDATLRFEAFIGGVLDIAGNSADTGASSGKAVVINFSDEQQHGFDIVRCQGTHRVRYLEINCTGTLSSTKALIASAANTFMTVSDNYVHGAASNQRGVQFSNNGVCRFFNVTMDGFTYGLNCSLSASVDVAASCIFSNNTTDIRSTQAARVVYEGVYSGISNSTATGGYIYDINGVVTPLVDTASIADDAITIQKIADNSISLAQMQNDSVGTAEIINGNVTELKIGTNAINQGKLQDSCVGTNELRDGEVTSAKLASGVVKDWVEVFGPENGDSPTPIVSNTWGTGIFIVYFDSTAGYGPDKSGCISVPNLSLDSMFWVGTTAASGYAGYEAAGQEFRLGSGLSGVDNVIAIYKWQ